MILKHAIDPTHAMKHRSNYGEQSQACVAICRQLWPHKDPPANAKEAPPFPTLLVCARVAYIKCQQPPARSRLQLRAAEVIVAHIHALLQLLQEREQGQLIGGTTQGVIGKARRMSGKIERRNGFAHMALTASSTRMQGTPLCSARP